MHEVEARESCRIWLHMPSGSDGLYKIYVNRNIRLTPSRLKSRRPVSGEVIPVEPGEYAVVVRESEVYKPGRVESNTISVVLQAQEEVKLVLNTENGALVLSYDH